MYIFEPVYTISWIKILNIFKILVSLKFFKTVCKCIYETFCSQCFVSRKHKSNFSLWNKPPHLPLQPLCLAPGSLVGHIQSSDSLQETLVGQPDPLMSQRWWCSLWSTALWTDQNSQGRKEAAVDLQGVYRLLVHPDRGWEQGRGAEQVEGWGLWRGQHQRRQPETWWSAKSWIFSGKLLIGVFRINALSLKPKHCLYKSKHKVETLSSYMFYHVWNSWGLAHSHSV